MQYYAQHNLTIIGFDHLSFSALLFLITCTSSLSVNVSVCVCRENSTFKKIHFSSCLVKNCKKFLSFPTVQTNISFPSYIVFTKRSNSRTKRRLSMVKSEFAKTYHEKKSVFTQFCRVIKVDTSLGTKNLYTLRFWCIFFFLGQKKFSLNKNK